MILRAYCELNPCQCNAAVMTVTRGAGLAVSGPIPGEEAGLNLQVQLGSAYPWRLTSVRWGATGKTTTPAAAFRQARPLKVHTLWPPSPHVRTAPAARRSAPGRAPGRAAAGAPCPGADGRGSRPHPGWGGSPPHPRSPGPRRGFARGSAMKSERTARPPSHRRGETSAHTAPTSRDESALQCQAAS